MLMDWSGEVVDGFGLSGVDKEAVGVVVDGDGKILGSGSGTQLGEQILAVLSASRTIVSSTPAPTSPDPTRPRHLGGADGRSFGIDSRDEGGSRAARALRRRDPRRRPRRPVAGHPAQAPRPETRVLVADKRAEPAPEAAFKVGESTVEIGAYYYREILGMADHLERAPAAQARPALLLSRRGQQRHHPPGRVLHAGDARRSPRVDPPDRPRTVRERALRPLRRAAAPTPTAAGG